MPSGSFIALNEPYKASKLLEMPWAIHSFNSFIHDYDAALAAENFQILFREVGGTHNEMDVIRIVALKL